MAVSQRKPGDINPNDQILIARTDRPGTDYLQYVWVLVCARRNPGGAICGHRYGANGSDFHIRKCPSCQRGAAGLDIEGLL
ncbi:hypothetical protein KD146_16030 [Devosia sp. BSSL-BM10]|uniref:Uncharacterized protein n=1 Tax=Devosia litorisediminis TaxID=2829817 RepID=A0A942IEY4_9HYPH|nr:hypothetical protein [Devosia litorisediminis]MBS3850209.1 hypothetical protein [Devosia litorisediminis]